MCTALFSPHKCPVRRYHDHPHFLDEETNVLAALLKDKQLLCCRDRVQLHTYMIRDPRTFVLTPHCFFIS